MVDLDNPSYASSIIGNEDYTPSKNVQVNMPHFDGNNPEGWMLSVDESYLLEVEEQEGGVVVVEDESEIPTIFGKKLQMVSVWMHLRVK